MDKKIKFTEEDIKLMADELADKLWNVKVDVPIRISGRLTSVFGHYKYRNVGSKIVPIEIKLAKRLVEGDYKYSTVESVLKHELCHWYLSITGKKFGDMDDDFSDEIKRIGSTLSFTLQGSGYKYILNCKECGTMAARTFNQNKANKWATDERYSSKCCGAGLVLAGKEFIEDANTKYTKGLITSMETLKTLTKQNKQTKENVIAKVADVPSKLKDNVNATIINKGQNDKNVSDNNDQIKQRKAKKIDEDKDNKGTKKPSNGKKMTNGIIVPLIKEAVDNKNVNELIRLKTEYPDIYKMGLKYVGTRRMSYLEKLSI